MYWGGNRKFLLETALVVRGIKWMKSRRPFHVWLGTIGPYLHISWHNEMTLSCSYPSRVSETEIPQPRHHSAELLAHWATVIGWKQDVTTSTFCLLSSQLVFSGSPLSLTWYHNRHSRQMLPGIYPLNTNLRNWRTNSDEEPWLESPFSLQLIKINVKHTQLPKTDY